MKLANFAFSGTLAAACAAFLLLSAGCSSEPEPPPLPKLATVTANPLAPPMAWLEDGEFKGVGIEVAKIVLRNQGIEPSIVYAGAWDEALAKVRDGKIDMVAGVYKTEERMRYLEYSEPYYKESVSVCVKRGKAFPFSRWDDLKGKKGVLGLGESYGEDFDAFAKDKLTIERKPIKECLADVAAGKADYLIISRSSGMIASWQCGLSDQIDFIEIPVTTQAYHLAISKKSPFVAMLPKINERIRSLRIDGAPERFAARFIIAWKNKEILHSPASDAALKQQDSAQQP